MTLQRINDLAMCCQTDTHHYAITLVYPFFAAQNLLNADLETVSSLGFDLLIDEDTIVRSTTIRAMSTMRVPGWIKVMTRSLLDSDYVIQRAAMDGLLEDRQKGVPALIEYVSKNPQSRISNLAIIELNKIGIQL